MSETAFTPGLWSADSGSRAPMMVRARGCVVAEVIPQPSGIGEANARLIAAAPEMYAALERCIALFGEIRGDWTDPREECREGMAVARAALAKATGGAA